MEKTLNEKIAELLVEIKPIKKDDFNPFFKSYYTNINSLLEVIKPMLANKGLSLTQAVIVENGKNILHTKITDWKDSFESMIALPDLTDPQKIGSCITYYRRYALQAMLCIEAEDDDGNLASGKEEKKEVKKLVPDGFDKPMTHACPICGVQHNGKNMRCADCIKAADFIQTDDKKKIWKTK